MGGHKLPVLNDVLGDETIAIRSRRSPFKGHSSRPGTIDHNVLGSRGHICTGQEERCTVETQCEENGQMEQEQKGRK